MSLGQLLVTVRDHLRTNVPLDKAQCGIQIDGLPPGVAGELYVALGEGGAQNTAGDMYQLLERYTIIVSLFRRAGQYPLDLRGDLLKREATAIKSLEELERKTIKLLHNNYSLMNDYNTQLGVPHDVLGDKAVLPLFYVNKGPTQMYVHPVEEGTDLANAWLRRDMRFAGMDRHQLIESMG